MRLDARTNCVVERTADSITLTARGYVHAVELEGEYLLADNCFSMLKGETRTIKMTALSDVGTLGVLAYTLR